MRRLLWPPSTTTTPAHTDMLAWIAPSLNELLIIVIVKMAQCSRWTEAQNNTLSCSFPSIRFWTPAQRKKHHLIVNKAWRKCIVLQTNRHSSKYSLLKWKSELCVFKWVWWWWERHSFKVYDRDTGLLKGYLDCSLLAHCEERRALVGKLETRGCTPTEAVLLCCFNLENWNNRKGHTQKKDSVAQIFVRLADFLLPL